jgi:hypothetical protein
MLGSLALASSPPGYTPGFILPWLFRPFRVPSLFSPARRLSTLRHYLPWVSSLITTSPNSVWRPFRSDCSHMRTPILTVPPTGFLNLSTAFSAAWLAGLFHPAAVSRVHPVQGLLSSCSRSPSSRESLPPCRCRDDRSPKTPRRLWLPQSPLLDFEAFLRTKQRC